MVMPGGSQRRFITDVGDIGTGETGRMLGHEGHIEILSELQSAQVDLEDLLAFLQLREFNVDLAVETARAHERTVQDIGPVGSRQHDYAGIAAETVHFGQELIEGVFPFVIRRPSRIFPTGTPHRINLIDENDARGLFLGLTEEVAYAGCTHAHEHFHEVRTGNGEERNVRLARYRLGQQSFTGSGRADQQGSFGDFAAQGRVFGRILQEVNDFHHLFLGAIEAGYVLEGHVDLVLVGQFAGSLAHVEGIRSAHAAVAHAPAHAAEHEDPHQNQQDGEQEPLQDLAPHAFIVHHDHLNLLIRREGGIQLAELGFGVKLGGIQEKEMGRRLGHLAAEVFGILGQALGTDRDLALEVVAGIFNLFDITRTEHLLDLGPFDFLRVRRFRVAIKHPPDAQDEQQVEPGKI